MNLHEIKAAVIAGKVVHWSNDGYRVTRDCIGQWFIEHQSGAYIGLTHADGRTLNGKHAEFYISDSAP